MHADLSATQTVCPGGWKRGWEHSWRALIAARANGIVLSKNRFDTQISQTELYDCDSMFTLQRITMLPCRCCAEEALSHEYLRSAGDDPDATAVPAVDEADQPAQPPFTDVDMISPFGAASPASASPPRPTAAEPVPGDPSEIQKIGRSKTAVPAEAQRRRQSSCEAGLRLAATAGGLTGGTGPVWPAMRVDGGLTSPNGSARGKRYRSASCDIPAGEAVPSEEPGAPACSCEGLYPSVLHQANHTGGTDCTA